MKNNSKDIIELLDNLYSKYDLDLDENVIFEIPHIVRCVDNTDWKTCLTVGKQYEAFGIEAGWYQIVDDTGGKYLYPKTIFVEIR